MGTMNPEPRPINSVTFKCNKCHRPFTRFQGSMTRSYICMPCNLWNDILKRAFSKVTGTADMILFDQELNEWYPVESLS